MQTTFLTTPQMLFEGNTVTMAGSAPPPRFFYIAFSLLLLSSAAAAAATVETVAEEAAAAVTFGHCPDCGQNDTRYDVATELSADLPISNNAPLSSATDSPDIWCPDGYWPMQMKGIWFEACMPYSCARLTNSSGDQLLELPKGVQVRKREELLAAAAASSGDGQEDVFTVCKALDQDFRSTAQNGMGAGSGCPKRILTSGQYRFNGTDLLVTHGKSDEAAAVPAVVAIGRYFVQSEEDKVVICAADDGQPQAGQATVSVDLPTCAAYNFSIDKVKFNEKSRSLLLTGLSNGVSRRAATDQKEVSWGFFDPRPFQLNTSSSSNSSQETSIQVCLTLAATYFRCQYTALQPGDYALDPSDLGLNLTQNGSPKGERYERGHYVLQAAGNDDEGAMALVCIDEESPDVAKRVETRYIYGTACVLSVVFLALSLLAHIYFPNLNYHAKPLLCHNASLLVTYIALAVRLFAGHLQTDLQRLVLFAFQYVFALAAFFWLNVLAFDLWRVFANLKGAVNIQGTTKDKRFVLKCLYAWGIPVALCAITIIIALIPEIQEFLGISVLVAQYSWFHDDKSVFAFFYSSVIVILVENVIFFALTVFNIRKASRGTDILNRKVSKQLLKVFIKLFLVMGLCWFTEIISWLVKDVDESVWYATDLINCLQGVAIFLVYVCKKKTLKIFKSKMGMQVSATSGSGSHNTHSSGAASDKRPSDPNVATNGAAKRPNVTIPASTTIEMDTMGKERRPSKNNTSSTA